jgi:hypothetical protein
MNAILSHYIEELDLEIRRFGCSCKDENCSCEAFNLSDRLLNGRATAEQAEYEFAQLQERDMYL